MADLRAPDDCDVAVIGGGIVGLATARELLRRDPQLKLALFERRPRLATEQTGRTSGVIHAGIYYEPGSLKAKLCVEGARRLYEYCEERGIEARREGKLIIATKAQELPRLDELERRGTANGVRGLRRLGPEEIIEVEPHARGLAALHSPETGVVDFRAVAAALAGDVREGGGGIFTGSDVKALIPRGKRLELVHDLGLTRARTVVACAGAGSDKLAVAAGAPAEPRIVPFRGAYLQLRSDKADLVRASVYQVPDPDLPFLGAHLTRTFDSRVLLGPTALMTGGFAWPGAWRLAVRHRRAAMREVRHAIDQRSLVAEAQRLMPDLRPDDFGPGPTGVRAQAMNRDGTLVDDFVIHETERAIHVRNAPSPAATSALALSQVIANRVEIV
jgi:L-2-hydroxyglutarate oxidase LhgO